jgi:NADPH:quinone reductase-like Zn-dependent oxidoreductase
MNEEYVCLPQQAPDAVTAKLDAAQALGVVVNYISAYQMLHPSAGVEPGQRVSLEGASGGVVSSLSCKVHTQRIIT